MGKNEEEAEGVPFAGLTGGRGSSARWPESWPGGDAGGLLGGGGDVLLGKMEHCMLAAARAAQGRAVQGGREGRRRIAKGAEGTGKSSSSLSDGSPAPRSRLPGSAPSLAGQERFGSALSRPEAVTV